MLTASVDSRGFQAMLKDLSRISGKTFREVLKQQTAAVISAAIRYTPKTKLKESQDKAEGKIQRKFNTYSEGKAGGGNNYVAGIMFEGTRGSDRKISITRGGSKEWLREDGRFYLMNDPQRRWAQARYAAFRAEDARRQADRAQAIRRGRLNVARARGLREKSWLQSAEQLGIESLVKAPAYVRNATAANGAKYQNGRGIQGSAGGTEFFRIENNSPLLVGPKGGGALILQRAVKARQSAFNSDMRRGVFQDLKTRAQRYPGIFVKP